MWWIRFQGQAMRKAVWQWTELRSSSPLEVHGLERRTQGQEGRTVYSHFCTVLIRLKGVAEEERERKTYKLQAEGYMKSQDDFYCTVSSHVFGERPMGQTFIFWCFLIFLSCLTPGAPGEGLGNAAHHRDVPWRVTKQGWGAIIIRGQF